MFEPYLCACVILLKRILYVDEVCLCVFVVNVVEVSLCVLLIRHCKWSVKMLQVHTCIIYTGSLQNAKQRCICYALF